ncbi:MAG TPA: response regulator [Candidatus Hydrogenedentes bacterium]|nr:response regulator [Candidatus Hydrogenedentota bacterium]
MTKFLIVDDHEENRYLLQALLQGNGYEVVVAADGAEALQKAREAPPDMIISDILMPVMDGYTLCREWKQDEQLKKIPFVFYTATYTDPRDEAFALSLGAERFVIKPQEPDVFAGIIKEVIAEQQTRTPSAPAEAVVDEAGYFKTYSETLIRKLENKLTQLETANRALVEESAQREKVEASLRASEAKFRNMVDNIGIGVSLISPEMRVLEMNNKMESWFPEAARQDAPLCYQVFHNPALEHACPACPTVQALRDGQVHEAVIDTFNQGKMRHYRIIASPLLDEQGKISAAIEMVEDITERLLLEEQFRQAQKMEAVGRLAGGVAHDFNNILQAMIGYSQLMKDLLPEGGKAREYVNELAKSAERASILTRQLLAFSRRQVLKMEDLDLNIVIQNVVKMIQRLIGEDVRLHVAAGQDLGVIHADQGQMEQILMNLCINSRDAMPEGGVLMIETENAEIGDDYCEAHPWAAKGRYVLLSVTDTGCGMDAETQQRIFEPFFTTKPQGKGTGLGLATVYGIVQQHQGMVRVYSEVNNGTTFKIYLPVVARELSTPSVVQKDRPPEGSETILLAEDDDAVRELAARILTRKGYTVLTAVNGQEAIRMFRESKQKIDLVILDVIMPEGGGEIVYNTLQAEYPHARFLFSSGYSTQTVHTGFVLKEGVELIQKPYPPDALLHKVRQILDQG